MISETKIILSNGDMCFIRVRFNDLYKRLIIENVEIIPKGRESKESYNFNDDINFKNLSSFEERYQYKLDKFLEHPDLAKEHLLDALNQTWESIKPVLLLK